MKIIGISDTHGVRPPLPYGDVLAHCGDWSHWEGTLRELAAFCRWMNQQPHTYKILISGNHDFIFFNDPEGARAMVEEYGILYLEDSAVTIDGISFWGSPWQPKYKGWAFGLDEDSIIKKWALIPSDVDVLLTHSPPAGILDTDSTGKRQGCPHLRDKVAEVQPKLHVFGHMHEGHGSKLVGKTIYVNASICGKRELDISDGKVWAKMEIQPARVIEI